MTFQIYTFLFLLLSAAGFYLIAPCYRKGFLVAASAVFCWIYDPYALAVLVCMTLFTYGAGVLSYILKKDGHAVRRIVMTLAIAVFVGLFVFWKVFSKKLDIEVFVMPIGFSYYGFQAISYISDVFHEKYPAEKNILSLALYLAWFPKFTSGPIERADDMLPQIRELGSVRLFDGRRIIRALSYILWGLFMKLMIADRAAAIASSFFEEPEEYGSVMLVIASLLYTIRIYCDFAGYTDVAIGVSCLFGIELTQNFKTPYFSENITEFWRRWHISLSSFLKDYVYIPLGGNRKGKIRQYLNLLIVFIICAFWHGSSRGFIIWGLIHGVFSVLTNVLKKSRLSFLFRGAAGTVITFCVVSFAWIFFRFTSWTELRGFLTAMFTAPPFRTTLQGELQQGEVSVVQIIILLISLAILYGCDLYSHRKDTLMPEIIIKTGEIRRDVCFLLMAVIILVFGAYGDQEIKNFIYMRF